LLSRRKESEVMLYQYFGEKSEFWAVLGYRQVVSFENDCDLHAKTSPEHLEGAFGTPHFHHRPERRPRYDPGEY
jgi:hypothetical protein